MKGPEVLQVDTYFLSLINMYRVVDNKTDTF